MVLWIAAALMLTLPLGAQRKQRAAQTINATAHRIDLYFGD
jgi:hypothetical protein